MRGEMLREQPRIASFGMYCLETRLAVSLAAVRAQIGDAVTAPTMSLMKVRRFMANTGN
jgi:hypothetical protein